MATYTVPFIIDGEDRHAASAFDVVSPATGATVHRCGVATEQEALAAVDAAAAAGRQWRDTSPAQRRDIILRAAELMGERRAELAQYMIDEVGASPEWAGFNLSTAIEMMKDTAGRIATLTGSVPTSADPGRGAMILREPYGVVLAIAPWNAPYILGTRSVLFPLAAGNTVVLKGSEKAPRVMHAIAAVLRDAGLPKGVLNFVATDLASAAPVTTALIAHPQVKKLNFTGSTAVGRIVGRLAGQHLKPAVLELGGKAPAIVWRDADLDVAAEQCALGAFLFAGQICMSTEKIVVHKEVAAAFREKLAAAVERMFPSGGEALVLIAREAVEKNRALLRDATGKGAELVHGSLDADAEEGGKTPTGTRMRPVVIGGVTPAMDLYRQESFGPTASLLEVDTEEEALRVANDTEYGLIAAVFTEDLRTGLRLARRIEAGSVHINNMTVHDEMALPHGGAKASGFGRFNNSAGLDEWVRTKAVTWRH